MRNASDNILRFMRSRRQARAESNQPTTSSSAQNEAQLPPVPAAPSLRRVRPTSSRIALDRARIAERIRPPSSGQATTASERFSALQTSLNRLRSAARPYTRSPVLPESYLRVTRRRPAARSSQQLASSPSVIDLTSSDTEASNISRLLAIASSSSSSSSDNESLLSVPSLGPTVSDSTDVNSSDSSDSSDSDINDIIRLPPLPTPSPSSSDDEE